MHEILGVPAGACGCEKSTAPRYAPGPAPESTSALGVVGNPGRVALPATHKVDRASATLEAVTVVPPRETAMVDPAMNCDPNKLPVAASTCATYAELTPFRH